MRRSVVVAMAVLVMTALIGAGSARAALDTTFGEGGTAKIEPPAPSGWTQNLGAIALSSSGEAYAVSNQNHCGYGGCQGGAFVYRYQANGQLDSAFANSRGWEVPNEGYERPLIAVDSAGRPVVARSVGNEAVIVRRLTPTGQLDLSFGSAGAVALPCGCGYENTRLMTGREGSIFVVVPRSNAQDVRAGGGGTGITLIALDSTGHRLSGFGTRGVSSVSLPGTEEFTYSAIAPSGAMYFGGSSTGKSAYGGWLARVSAKGKLDTKFTDAALKSLRRLEGLAGVPGRVNAVVISHKGKIELYGTAGSAGGFELRLLASGKIDTSFAKNGLRILPYSIVSAIRGSEGASMLLTGEEIGTPRLLRILGNGQLDKKFGSKGEMLPATASKNGLVLEPGGKQAVTVVDHGYHECRFSCESTPYLYRFLERP